MAVLRLNAFDANATHPARHFVHYDRPAAVRYDRCARELGYLHAKYGSAGATGNHFLKCIRYVSGLRCRAVHDPHWMRAGYDPRAYQRNPGPGDGQALEMQNQW